MGEVIRKRDANSNQISYCWYPALNRVIKKKNPKTIKSYCKYCQFFLKYTLSIKESFFEEKKPNIHWKPNINNAGICRTTLGPEMVKLRWFLDAMATVWQFLNMFTIKRFKRNHSTSTWFLLFLSMFDDFLAPLRDLATKIRTVHLKVSECVFSI